MGIWRVRFRFVAIDNGGVVAYNEAIEGSILNAAKYKCYKVGIYF